MHSFELSLENVPNFTVTVAISRFCGIEMAGQHTDLCSPDVIKLQVKFELDNAFCAKDVRSHISYIFAKKLKLKKEQEKREEVNHQLST